MSTSTSTTPNNVRIVSYNLLSSKLSRSSHFTHANPDHLEAEYRLPLILAKLDEAMKCEDFGGKEKSSDDEESTTPPPPTIFALQEVCYPFASELHTFFAQRGYHFVTGLYGRPFNGYMGVGLAYPLKDFETVNVDICRLSDEREGGWPREQITEEENSGEGFRFMIQKFTKTIATQAIQTINKHVIKRLSGYNNASEKKVLDPWDMSERRFNVLLTCVLRFRSMGTGGESSGSTFSISNYHMPCAFFCPPVMNIHSEMVSKRVQYLAAESWKKSKSNKKSDVDNSEALVEEEETMKTIPYILAGDFNIMPDSPHYKLLTTGKLDKSDPTYPPPKHGVEWKIECNPMDSAYALEDATGAEPEFTNYAHCREDPDPFIGTLDYIFLSQKECTTSSITKEGNDAGEWWKVHGVQELPCKDDSGGPFPNEKEPSDHYLISADLELAQSNN